ncbi:PLP-dependent aminotransferase family protein [Microbacterium rhizomatis]|nr:PLP-dependent aminotransferase family protein [Microbacterium rhizomatis]
MTDVLTPLAPPALAARVAGLASPSAFGAVLGASPITAISFAGGSPAAEALPWAELIAATAVVLESPARSAVLDYSGHQGSPALRAWIAEREGVDADRVVITNGALHGLSLSFLATVDPADVVVVENPVYPLAVKTLQLTGAEIHPVPLDADGLRTDVLEERLRAGLRPRALYTVPDFHNPTGRTLSPERRAHLVELADTYGFVVVSDNPYAELRGHGARPADLDVASDRVIRVNSFSKTFGPGLRLGWAVVPEWVRPGVLDLRARGDQHASTLTQAVVAELVSRPSFFDGLVGAAASLYRERAVVLEGALRAELGDAIEVSAPDGGVFAWPRFVDESVSVDDIAAAAARAGVVILPGSQFAARAGSAGGDADAADIARHARTSFGQASPEQIHEGVRRLGAAYREVAR